MRKACVWTIVEEESDNIIDGIRSGEISSQKEISDYLYNRFSFRVAFAVESVIKAYMACESVDLPIEL